MVGRARVMRIYSLIGILTLIMGAWITWSLIFTSSEEGPEKLPRRIYAKEKLVSIPKYSEHEPMPLIEQSLDDPVEFKKVSVSQSLKQIKPPKFTKVLEINTDKILSPQEPPVMNNDLSIKPRKNFPNRNPIQKLTPKKRNPVVPKLQSGTKNNTGKKLIDKSIKDIPIKKIPKKYDRKLNPMKEKWNAENTIKLNKRIDRKSRISNPVGVWANTSDASEWFDLKNIEEDMEIRRSRVREVCGKYGAGPLAHRKKEGYNAKMPPTANLDVFYIDRRDELGWCPIYKSASSSWLYNFCLLGGATDDILKKTKDQLSVTARRYWPELPYEDAQLAINAILKFIIVRHPFERLVSAYRDKLENINIGKEHGTEHFYRKYGKKIREKYRPITNGEHKYSQDMDNPNLPSPRGDEPTFEEFVKYLIDTDLVTQSDDHWMPYYLHCSICQINYNVIAKFETLQRDQQYIIQKRKLGNVIKPAWKHLTKGKETSSIVQKYFSTITKEDLYKLYHKYKVDFELFDYNIVEYIYYVRDN